MPPIDRLQVLAPAKVAPRYVLTRQRQNGWWEIDSLAFPIDLFDVVRITLDNTGKVAVRTDSEHVPDDDQNLCYLPVRDFCAASGRDELGVQIEIEKHIPVSAGLGGGSANVAAALVGLNSLLGAQWTRRELASFAGSYTADAAFLVAGFPARVGPTPIDIEPLGESRPLSVALFLSSAPPLPNKTAEVFSRIPAGRPGLQPSAGSPDAYASFVTPQLVPEFAPQFLLLDQLRRQGIPAQFTGSGPTVACVVPEELASEVQTVATCLGNEPAWHSTLLSTYDDLLAAVWR